MQSRDYRDILAGALMFGIGLFAAIYAVVSYPLGALNHMGPAMFPMGVGCVLAALGVLIAVPAWFREGALPKPEFRPLLTILLGVTLFAFTVRRLGMVPATVLMTVCAVYADTKLGIVGALILSAGLAGLGYLVFSVLLDVPLSVFNWPF